MLEYHCFEAKSAEINTTTSIQIVYIAINVKMGESSISSLKASIELSPNLESLLINRCSYNLLSLFDLATTTMNIIGVGSISNLRHSKSMVLRHSTETNNIVSFAPNLHFSLQEIQILLQRNKHSLERLYTPELWDNVIVQNPETAANTDERDLGTLQLPEKLDRLNCIRLQNIHSSQPWTSLENFVQICQSLKELQFQDNIAIIKKDDSNSVDVDDEEGLAFGDNALNSIQNITRGQTFTSIKFLNVNIFALGIRHLIQSCSGAVPDGTSLSFLTLSKCSGDGSSIILSVALIKCLETLELIGCQGLFVDVNMANEFIRKVPTLENLKQLYMEKCAIISDNSIKNLSN